MLYKYYMTISRTMIYKRLNWWDIISTHFYNTDPCIIHIICGINLSLHIWIPIIHNNHWVTYYANLVHSRIDIFYFNHERTKSLVQWHSKIKAKFPLIYDALCKATDWKKHKMPNLKRFKYPFQPCTLQGYVNDDAFFAWKNIELWNGNTWQGTIEEVWYYTFTTAQSLYCCNTLSQPGHHFNAVLVTFRQHCFLIV
jgi:hypothetical protein